MCFGKRRKYTTATELAEKADRDVYVKIRATIRATRVLRRYSAQSAMKMFVSCGALWLRFEAQTSRLPSEENMGKASKPG